MMKYYQNKKNFKTIGWMYLINFENRNINQFKFTWVAISNGPQVHVASAKESIHYSIKLWISILSILHTHTHMNWLVGQKNKRKGLGWLINITTIS